MKKLFITRGNSTDNSLKDRALERAKELYPNEEIEVFFPSEVDDVRGNTSLFYFGELLEHLVLSDLIYFGEDWKSSTLAQLEHHGAIMYGVQIIND